MLERVFKSNENSNGKLEWKQYLTCAQNFQKKTDNEGYYTQPIEESEVKKIFNIYKRSSGSTNGVTLRGIKSVNKWILRHMKIEKAKNSEKDEEPFVTPTLVFNLILDLGSS